MTEINRNKRLSEVLSHAKYPRCNSNDKEATAYVRDDYNLRCKHCWNEWAESWHRSMTKEDKASPKTQQQYPLAGIGQQLNSLFGGNGQCPTGTELSGNQCIVSGSTAVTCSIPDGSIITPITLTVSTPSQTVPRGSAVTLTAVAAP